MDEEEAVAVFFATAAFNVFFAAAAFIALVSRTSYSWGGCRCVILPDRTGSPELARRRTRFFLADGLSPASAYPSGDSSPTSSIRGGPAPALLASPADFAH